MPSFSWGHLHKTLRFVCRRKSFCMCVCVCVHSLLRQSLFHTLLLLPRRHSLLAAVVVLQLIVDTGSTITYVPCSDCSHCGQHSNDFFQPKNSSTFRTIGCKEKLCSDKVCTEGSCAYFRHYAENSSSRGSLVEDVLGLKNPDIQSPPAKIIFGCENLESGDLYAQTADGIMGLGNAEIAIHNQVYIERERVSKTRNTAKTNCMSTETGENMCLIEMCLFIIVVSSFSPQYNWNS